MKPGIVQALADALGLWRRERSLVTRVAGMFFALPTMALSLVMDGRAASAAVTADDSEARAEFLASYLAENAHWLLAHAVIELLGAGVLLALFLHPGRPTVGDAMRLTLRRAPTLIAVAAVGFLAMLGGLMLFFVPGFYAIGRFFVATPVVFAEPDKRLGDVVQRAIALTQGHGFALFAVAAAIFLAGQLGGTVVGAFGAIVTTMAGSGPVTAALAALLLAVVSAGVSIAFVLSRIAVYRRLAASIRG